MILILILMPMLILILIIPKEDNLAVSTPCPSYSCHHYRYRPLKPMSSNPYISLLLLFSFFILFIDHHHHHHLHLHLHLQQTQESPSRLTAHFSPRIRTSLSSTYSHRGPPSTTSFSKHSYHVDRRLRGNYRRLSARSNHIWLLPVAACQCILCRPVRCSSSDSVVSRSEMEIMDLSGSLGFRMPW